MSLTFDGSGQYVDCGVINITGQITITAWTKFRLPSQSAFATILAKRNDGAGSNLVNYGFDKAPTSGGELRFYTGTGTTFIVWSSSGAMLANQSNKFCHVAVTYDASSDPKFYINGSVRPAVKTFGPAGFPILPVAASSTTRIGWYNSGNIPFDSMKGDLVDVRLYDRALRAAEIETMYAAEGVGGIVQNLRGRWFLNEKHVGFGCSGSFVKDLGPDTKNGTGSGLFSGGPVYSDTMLKDRRKRHY